MSMLRKKMGHFYLVRQLGSGRGSEVFLGINPRTREKRAFKILGQRAAMSPPAFARLLREVDLIASLIHPGIIRILDSGLLEDFCCYSMEFMPGGNLNRRLAHGKIPINEVVRLFIPMCEAMAYAHEQAVVHGNLKPSNILFTAAGDPVISDFGLANVSDLERACLNQPGEIMGTIAYLAPEQRFSSGNVNRRADVYALGAILYEMLMGFPALGRFPWPRDVQAGFPQSLSSILERCLAPAQEIRFEHAGFLQLELEKHPYLKMEKKTEISGGLPSRGFFAAEDAELPPAITDRIEAWFNVLRTGTTRQRLAGVREMVDQITPAEAKAVLKLYAEEGDRVRWGLIRVLGELKIEAATSLIIKDLNSPFHAECAIEALGKIGSDEAYNAIREYVVEHPESAIIALLPLAKTGRQRAIKHLRRYLWNEMPALRQAAVEAIASIATVESLQALKEHLCVERDEKVRSNLLQAVHSLQAVLLPEFKTTMQGPETVLNVRNL
jgi:serine/threonine protein kinase